MKANVYKEARIKWQCPQCGEKWSLSYPLFVQNYGCPERNEQVGKNTRCGWCMEDLTFDTYEIER